MTRTFGVVLIAGVVVAATIELFLVRASLPERVATHFTFDGTPDGWMGRDAFVVLTIALLAGVGGLFLVLSVFVPRLPDTMLNLPHKRYWLAPERRERTRDAISAMLALMGGVTTTFVYVAFRVILAANRDSTPRLTMDRSWLIAAFAVALAAVPLSFVLRFRKPPAGDPPAA